MLRKRAFTLVELLVVIVIISMLMALLLPALISARGRARIAQCTNNQHELALAITQYDVAKRRLPGALNQVRGTMVGWAPVLFPFMGRADLWKDIGGSIKGWRYGRDTDPSDGDGVSPTPYIKSLICPDDNDPSVPCPLSYVVNLGLYNANPNNTFHQEGATGTVDVGLEGLFRDHSGGTINTVSLSDVDSPSQTVMLGEKIITMTSRPGDYVPATPVPGRQWTGANFTQLGFSWPNYPAQPAPAPPPSPLDAFKDATVGIHYLMPPASVKYWGPLPSIHPGIVIVTFADGHTESVSEDIECQVYKALP